MWQATRSLDCTLIFEPGRLIVGNAGILVTRVLYVKRAEAKTFVIVDAGMNDLMQPTPTTPTTTCARSGKRRRAPPGSSPTWSARCEYGDFLARDRAIVEPAAGDLLAVMTAGAYGAVQAGTYNTRPLVGPTGLWPTWVSGAQGRPVLYAVRRRERSAWRLGPCW